MNKYKIARKIGVLLLGLFLFCVGNTDIVKAEDGEIHYYTKEEAEELLKISDSMMSYCNDMFDLNLTASKMVDNAVYSAVPFSSISYLGSWTSGDLTFYTRSYSGTSAVKDNLAFYIGECHFVNGTDNPVAATYTQSTTKTCTAELSAAVNASAEIQTKVFSFVRETLSINCQLSATIIAGTTYSSGISGSTSVDPHSSLSIVAYMGGVFANGTIYADVFLNSGGYFIEYNRAVGIGDKVVNPSSISLVFN